MSTEAVSALKSAVKMVQDFLAGREERKCDRVSPFILHFIYMVATLYLRMERTDQSGAIMDQQDIWKRALRVLSHRWLAAGKILF